MNPLRSLLAVVGGLAVILFTTQVLEVMLVTAVAGDTITDIEGFLVAANQPAMLAAKVVYSVLISILGGYLVAKVASVAPMSHAMFAALLLAWVLIQGFATDEMAAATPVSVRALLVVVMCGALLTGASIRAKAAALSGTNDIGTPDARNQSEETES